MYIYKRRQTPCACRLRSCRFIPFSTYRMNTSTKASVWTYQSAYSVSTQMSSSKSLPAKTSDNRFWLIKSNVVLSHPKARQSMLYIWIICRPTNIITNGGRKSERVRLIFYSFQISNILICFLISLSTFLSTRTSYAWSKS